MMEKRKNKTAATGADVNERTKRRWSAVDTAILLLTVLAVAGLVYRIVVEYNDAKAAEKAEKTAYRVYFTVDEMQSSVLDEMNGGDVLYIREDGTVLGYIAVRTAATTNGAGSAVDGAAEAVDTDNDETLNLDKAMTARPIENGTDPNAVTVEGVFVCNEWELVDGSLKSADGERYLTRGSVIDVRTDRAAMTIRITEIKTPE